MHATSALLLLLPALAAVALASQLQAAGSQEAVAVSASGRLMRSEATRHVAVVEAAQAAGAAGAAQPASAALAAVAADTSDAEEPRGGEAAALAEATESGQVDQVSGQVSSKQWCLSELRQMRGETVEMGTATKVGKQLLTAFGTLLDMMLLDDVRGAQFLLREFKSMDLTCSTSLAGNADKVETAVRAMPDILQRACNGEPQLTLLEDFRAASAVVATNLRCPAELGLPPAFLEQSGALMEGTEGAEGSSAEGSSAGEAAVAAALRWTSAADHRLEVLNALLPGAGAALKAALRPNGADGAASLAEVPGVLLERAAAAVRAAVGESKAGGKPSGDLYRPHPFGPGQPGQAQRESWRRSVCPSESAATLDNIFRESSWFDQGCSSPVPLGFVNIITPPCYGHDICCVCSVRTTCDGPLISAITRECDRKLAGWRELLNRGLCKGQAAVMGSATWVWGVVTGGSGIKVSTCNSACSKDVENHGQHLRALDTWFPR